MRLLTKNTIKGNEFEIYMKMIDTWTDPVLIIKDGKKQMKITASSGELELPLGEFLVNDNLVEDPKYINVLLESLADPASIKQISRTRKTFRVKDEYLNKVIEIYHGG